MASAYLSTAEEPEAFEAMQTILNYIDGQFLPPSGGAFLENVNPAEGKIYSKVPNSTADDVNLAVKAAQRAFPGWSTMANEERSKLLWKLADLIDANLERLALAESEDNGKTITLARALDIPRSSSNIRFYASALQHTSTEAHVNAGDSVNYTTRFPIGVVGCISPWNLPLYLFTWKIAPALAAGCTVVAKPSELTPMTAFIFSQLCIEAGLPAGVLNIVHGLGASAGQAIVEHPDITAISFTGGTVTGKKIAATAAPMFKKLSLELGGKNPTLVFADCAFEDTIRHTIRSAFTNQGEICLCGSRIYVERSLYEKFVNAFVAEAKKLVVGDPLLPETQIGALVSESHLKKVLGYVQLAREEGGTILTGGERLEISGRCKNGFFMSPTVITELNATCRVNQEEIFGPVVTIQPFDTEEEALTLANGTPYGLSASIWTQNLTRAHRVAHGVRSGIIWVNCWLHRDLRTPFGGMKQSGVGREGGWEAMRFFTDTKNVCVKL